MPWSIKKRDGKFCVIKDDGSVEKCHATRQLAVNQMKALYANEGKEMSEPNPDGTEELETKMYAEAMPYVPWGVTSFSDLEATRDADEAAREVSDMANDLQALLHNKVRAILDDETVSDKRAAIVGGLEELATELAGLIEGGGDDMETREIEEATLKDRLFQAVADVFTKAAMKTVGGKKYPAGDFLVVEDSSAPNTWHLQVKRNGKPDRGLAGAAWAALFSAGGHRGNKYGGPNKAAAGKKLRALYKAQGWETPNTKELMVWKDKDGSYHWVATYSNNYRDQDNPPEIIAAKSHKRFVEMVDKGDAKPPELWLWHVPEWKWGQADWVAYDDAGFALAGGTVDKGCEWLAEAINNVPHDKVLVSHGMPRHTIKREEKDNSIIVEHLTREVSPLLALAAANKITGFEILHKEGQTMTIPTEKRTALIEEWGLDPSKLDELEAANAQHAEGAKEAGIEAKEKDNTPTDESLPEPADEPTEETQESDLRTELVEALGALNERLGTIEANQAAMAKELTALKEADATKVAKAVEETPAASLADLIRGGRAVGSEEAKIDGRKSLARQGPQEAETKDAVPPVSVVPFLNQLVAPRQ